MKKKYEIIANENSPQITLKLPADIIKDLVILSNENGTAVEVEIAIRLARSLEKHSMMKAKDDSLMFRAFKCISQKDRK